MTYKTKKAIKIVDGVEHIYYFICDPYIPVYHLCKFLDIKGKNSKDTQKTYASILKLWLNYLNDKLSKKYYEVDFSDIKKYISTLVFFDKNNNYIITPDIVYKTLRMKINVILTFYKFLSGEVDCKTLTLSIFTNDKTFNVPFTFNTLELNKYAENAITFYMTRYKKGRKENYILEYTDEEINAIKSNFNTLRDKAVFATTLFGMRIDEVLSIKIEDFNYVENIVKPSRSKTVKYRPIVISKDLTLLINKYIQTERLESIQESGKNSIYLFVNLKKGKHCGNPLSYPTYNSIFKRAGHNAGFKKNELRTHSGRSSQTMRLLKQDVSHEMIRHINGWSSTHSITSYVDQNNKSLSIKSAKFLANTNNKES